MDAAPSRAEELFKQIINHPDPVGYLKGMINSDPPTIETEYLDFKGASRLDASSETIREHWAKALSSFANTEGGVLIWGIDAREDKTTKVDAAGELSLVKNTGALITRLETLRPNVTDPPVQGVVLKSYATESPEGFVVCFIPLGTFRPHRSEYNKKFYVRVGTNSVEPSVSWLRRMFAPAISPDLQLEVKVTRYEEARQSITKIRFSVSIRNEGTATAQEVYVRVKTSTPTRVDFDENRWSQRMIPPPGTAVVARNLIHPGETYPPFTLTKEYDGQRFRIDLEIFSLNQVPTVASACFEPLDQSEGVELRMTVDRKYG